MRRSCDCRRTHRYTGNLYAGLPAALSRGTRVRRRAQPSIRLNRYRPSRDRHLFQHFGPLPYDHNPYIQFFGNGGGLPTTLPNIPLPCYRIYRVGDIFLDQNIS